ncbi:SDR family NAD(P)-dependent oxidoreductase [Blastococcus sp. SYSU D00820]
MPTMVVLGARNLGGVILDHYLAAGWQAAAVVRSADTLEQVRSRGAVGLEADATDPGQLRAALEEVQQCLGRIDLIVNATSVGRPVPGEQYGGGPVGEAGPDSWDRWGGAVAKMAVVFLAEGARALRAGGGGGALVQIGNGLARRPRSGEGLWAGGQQAARALVHAAAEELRPEGIQVSLVVVDAPIRSPKLMAMLAAGGPGPRPADDALADMGAIAEAVAFAAGRDAGGLCYELVVSTAGQPWVP